MRPSDDDVEFLHNIIREGSQHQPSLEDDAPEDDRRQYLNDTGDGDVRNCLRRGSRVYRIHAYVN
jgi:hypothetical protein